MSILSVLASGNYITVNKTLIKELGLEEAIIFGELCSEYCYWEKEGKLVNGMFYCSASKLEENTTLSEYKQRQAIKNLIDGGYIKQELHGVPATRYFLISSEQVLKLFSISSVNFTELDPKNFNSSKNIYNKNKKKEKINDINTVNKQISLLPENNSKQHTIDNIYSLYTELCPNLPKVRVLNNRRKDIIFKAYKDYGMDNIKEAFIKANESEFLCGNNDRGWKADMEWILGTHFSNVLEGKYNTHKPNKPWEQGVKSTPKLTNDERQQIEDEAREMESQGIQMRF